MMGDIRRIGILTSGGDCAGLNAVLRAAVHRAVLGYDWEIMGIEQGTAGLMERPLRVRNLTVEAFDGTILRRGGTILGTTNSGNPFKYPLPEGGFQDRSQEVIDGCRDLGLDALIGITGQNFSFDQQAWKYWYASQKKRETFDVRHN